jgi:gamma-glutamylcyclotransferase (GGCT)/AIG2-like uncharacterized protein YtfP
VRALKPLFGYGTFRNAAWRAQIFGAEHRARTASVRGYRRVACGNGYLSLQRSDDPAARVGGVLIDLDEAGWAIADAWEGVPAYRRIDVAADTPDGRVDAVAYVCANDAGAVPVDDDRLALHADADVEAAIRDFAALRRR